MRRAARDAEEASFAETFELTQESPSTGLAKGLVLAKSGRFDFYRTEDRVHRRGVQSGLGRDGAT